MGTYRFLLLALALGALVYYGCGGEETDPNANNGGGTGAMGGGTAANGAGTGATGGGTGATGGGTGATGGGGGQAVCANGAPTFDELRAQAMADNPGVDFTVFADVITYYKAYSAYINESYPFKVPFWLNETSAMDPTEWKAYPAGSAIFEAETDNMGVLAEIKAPCERILVVYATGGAAGAMAELTVTLATPEEYAAGEERFNNGEDWVLNLPPAFDPLDMSTWPDGGMNMIDPPPPGTKCTACHTEGATQFQIINTPTQAAKFSDQVLINVFTLGQKPENPPCFRVLPKTDTLDLQQYYDDFHTWEMTDIQKKGMVVYLRSLSPQGQGDISVPGMDPLQPDPSTCLGR